MISSKKVIAIFLAGISMLSTVPVFASVPEEKKAEQRLENYTNYISEYKEEPCPTSEVSVKGSDYISDSAANIEIKDYVGRKDVVYWTSEQGSLEWEINVQEAGLYNIGIDYCPIPSKNTDIELAIYIDGYIPFSGADSFVLTRTWENETNDFIKDPRGNHLRPKQVEVFNWATTAVSDPNGRYNDPFKFYFDKGKHRIRLEIIGETLAIDKIKLFQVPEQEFYELPAVDLSSEGHLEIYQAEQTYEKSSPTLYPTDDRGNPSAQPAHPSQARYNTLGKNTFRHPGQWVSWQIVAPEDGYYNIAFKVRQNVQRGMYSARRIYIDGDVPFQELNNVKFPYNINWYTQVLGDDEPYLFYLEKGIHEIKMEVVTGDIAELLGQLEDIIYELNNWYRKIIMITGSNPDSSRQVTDVNRDFLLDQKIPGLMEGFKDIANRLESIKETIDSLSLGDGNTASFIDEVIAQLRSFVKQPETIPTRLDSYKGNMSSLSSIVLEMREQPLEIDYFVVYTPDEANRLPEAKANFVETLKFRSQMFISSFIDDYNAVGEVYEGDPIDVWVSTSDIAMTGISSGRDQAQVIKSLVDDLFVPDTNIGVNLSLVNSSESLIQAVLAGKGPDVALFIDKETPVNLAIRGALADLTQFEDFDEVKSRFYESALIPYYFYDKCYALPETQNYDVMFYRTDIFDELDLSPPKTWDEFHALAAILQINNMMVGIPENQGVFEMMLFQNKGAFYNEDLTQTAFDQPEALEAFKQWTGLYSKYGMPLVFDFFSRFRTGEMPIAIMPYTQSNYLTAAAPEIKGLWDIAPVPGTVNDDGSINNAVTSSGTGSIVIKGTGKEEESYEFIKWWTSAEVQGQFGNDLEQLMGPSARYPVANREAFDLIPWSRDQAESLKEQWEVVTDVPQVPGNYYISRNISFAFRSVVFNYKNERETLNKYNKEINKEISRKRLEFGLDTQKRSGNHE